MDLLIIIEHPNSESKPLSLAINSLDFVYTGNIPLSFYQKIAQNDPLKNKPSVIIKAINLSENDVFPGSIQFKDQFFFFQYMA